MTFYLIIIIIFLFFLVALLTQTIGSKFCSEVSCPCHAKASEMIVNANRYVSPVLSWSPHTI